MSNITCDICGKPIEDAEMDIVQIDSKERFVHEVCLDRSVGEIFESQSTQPEGHSPELTGSDSQSEPQDAMRQVAAVA